MKEIPGSKKGHENLNDESADERVPDAQGTFLTERQLARRWQVSEKKLQADRHSGSGCQYVGLNRLVRYRLSDVQAFEEVRLRTSTSTPVHDA